MKTKVIWNAFESVIERTWKRLWHQKKIFQNPIYLAMLKNFCEENFWFKVWNRITSEKRSIKSENLELLFCWYNIFFLSAHKFNFNRFRIETDIKKFCSNGSGVWHIIMDSFHISWLASIISSLYIFVIANPSILVVLEKKSHLLSQSTWKSFWLYKKCKIIIFILHA